MTDALKTYAKTGTSCGGVETADEIEDELRFQIRWLGILFGQPSELLRRLSVPEWRKLRTWVRAAEALAARLVRALAESLAAPIQAPASRSAPAFAIESTAPDTEHLDSGCWTGVRARFLCEPSADRSVRTCAADAGRGFASPPPPSSRAARGLALRFEAVIRVAESPARYARRLARRRARPPRRGSASHRRPVAHTPLLGPARIRTLGAPSRPPVIGTG